MLHPLPMIAVYFDIIGSTGLGWAGLGWAGLGNFSLSLDVIAPATMKR